MYTIPNQERYRVWQRPLDLPCDAMCVRITHERPEEVACNLGSTTELESGERVYEAADGPLPAGHVVRVELGQLPRPWTAYARWAALATLGALIVGVVGWSRRTKPTCRSPKVPTGRRSQRTQPAAPAGCLTRPFDWDRRNRLWPTGSQRTTENAEGTEHEGIRSGRSWFSCPSGLRLVLSRCPSCPRWLCLPFLEVVNTRSLSLSRNRTVEQMHRAGAVITSLPDFGETHETRAHTVPSSFRGRRL